MTEMKLEEGYTWKETTDGAKTHAVKTDDHTSILIIGSPEYDRDRHERAVCGTIAEFTAADEPEGMGETCLRCKQKLEDGWSF